MSKYKIYHATLSDVISQVTKFITTKKYNVPENFSDIFYFSHIEYGTTQIFNEKLSGEHKRDNGISFQIYRTSKGNYELNMYFWK